MALSDHAAGLKTLLLANCVRVSDVGISAVAAGCARLMHVDLNGCKHISPEATEVLIRASREWAVLCRQWCRTGGVLGVIVYCRWR